MSTEATRQRDRRADAFAAFLELVTEYGSAKIDCDMESYGREPGDIVTVAVTVCPDFVVSRTGPFTVGLVNEVSEAVGLAVSR